MRINFDMDGTFVDFYGVDSWLDYLLKEDTTPYKVAKPLFNLSLFARYLNILQKKGFEICIISWTSKNGSKEYNEKVKQAKMDWLAKHLKSVSFNDINIIDYGTPKENYGNGILFDDEKHNRDNWGGVAYDVDNILEILKEIIKSH